jgi:hypothetical protein
MIPTIRQTNGEDESKTPSAICMSLFWWLCRLSERTGTLKNSTQLYRYVGAKSVQPLASLRTRYRRRAAWHKRPNPGRHTHQQPLAVKELFVTHTWCDEGSRDCSSSTFGCSQSAKVEQTAVSDAQESWK